MILRPLSVSPTDPYSFHFIQIEPTHGLAGVYTTSNHAYVLSLSIFNSNTTKTNCQVK